jgi:starch synthase
MYALRYGTPPIATAVGGLRDTIDAWPSSESTGFMFRESDSDQLFRSVLEAVSLWETNQGTWRDMVHRAMNKDFSWERSAGSYINIYGELSEMHAF